MKKPHVVCIPAPAQGHINPVMQLAKLLYSRGFFITFVSTDFTHRCQGQESLGCLDGFRFEVIADGLPTVGEMMEDFEAFLKSVSVNCTAPFRDLMRKLHHPSDGHRVTCIISDAFMTFSLKVAEEMGVPEKEIKRSLKNLLGLSPTTFFLDADESYIGSGYLDTTIYWIPGMRDMCLRDLGGFIRVTDPKDFTLNFVIDEVQNSLKASMIIFNTFEDLEHEVLHAIRSMFPPHIYTIGPLLLQCRLLPDDVLKSVKSSLWKEEVECLKWLDCHEAASVIYVNFGSRTVSTPQQLIEFAWGIANSNHPFLWVIRPDLVMGGHTILPQDLMDEIEERGMLVSWCPQEDVLAHPSISLFLTRCGWNSTLESISYGVPMLCWPFFADQQTNCRYACYEWGVSMVIDNNVKRKEIGDLIREMMVGKKGKEVREKALKWKESAEIAIKEGGSSHTTLELLIQELAQLRDVSD
ncbi:UDP-glycosyltransferase 85K11 [Cinnamomum micranthum f. kanehirae]|uniref:UDP-glycosyltransferase 85K11 n=1 Tax=Cinnamomum micranthum f. kanehirae TaxID=337451 RepID=A0A3S4PAH2_9MAGN|nr:UDP-glycosyltransferase 85K11 [Cinnamomum micranthum f. kanehirae]